MAMLQELGGRAGVAGSSAQMGLLYEKEDRLSEAVQVLAQAFAIFSDLGVPQQEQVQRVLARLREKMGESVFQEAFEVARTADVGHWRPHVLRSGATFFHPLQAGSGLVCLPGCGPLGVGLPVAVGGWHSWRNRDLVGMRLWLVDFYINNVIILRKQITFISEKGGNPVVMRVL
jgi:hypothetical protein